MATRRIPIVLLSLAMIAGAISTAQAGGGLFGHLKAKRHCQPTCQPVCAPVPSCAQVQPCAVSPACESECDCETHCLNRPGLPPGTCISRCLNRLRSDLKCCESEHGENPAIERACAKAAFNRYLICRDLHPKDASVKKTDLCPCSDPLHWGCGDPGTEEYYECLNECDTYRYEHPCP